jgi:hypothetical protein
MPEGIERFADYWIPEPNTGCLLWLGPMGNKKSGPRKHHNGKNVIVCREVLREGVGEPPTPKHHAAHNTSMGCVGAEGGCVSLQHLRWATARENQSDIPPERRSERIRAGRAAMTPERRSEIAVKAYAGRN